MLNLPLAATTNTPTAMIKNNSVPTPKNNLSDVVEFKDSTIKAGATLSLMSILGHFPADNEYTQENLNKIPSLFTPNGAEYLTTLDDFKYMPNLEAFDIRYSLPGEKNLDPIPIGQLKNLKSFKFNTYMQIDSCGLTSLLPFKENKKLTIFGYNGNPITDASDSTLESMTSLENLDYSILTDISKVAIGDLDNLSNLKTLALHNLDLTNTPTLKQSSKLTSLDLSENKIKKIPDLSLFTDLKSVNYSSNALSDISNLKTVSNSLEVLDLHNNKLVNTDISNINNRFQNLNTLDLAVNGLSQIPDVSGLKKLKDIWLSSNNINDYTNLDKLNQIPTPPIVRLEKNILTANPNDVGYKGMLFTDYNFIVGHGLPGQYALKNIEDQTIPVNTTDELPVSFEREDGYEDDLELTEFQKAFTDTRNMTITTDNSHVLVKKSSKSSIKVTGQSVGTTKITLSYGNNLKTEFILIVQ